MKQFLLSIFVALTLILPNAGAHAAGTANVTGNRADIQFPDTITFSLKADNSASITSVALEYGTDQQTCGTVIARAFPDFTPGKKVSASWTWEMRQSGSLPPGAEIWWKWHIVDETGAETISAEQRITWLDDIHSWQTVSGGNINLHWYLGDSSFGKALHDSAVAGLDRLENETGIATESPVDLYIYGNFNDMRDAILYEPGWTGGQAFSEYDIVIIGIEPKIIEWGKRTEVHELTHVLVGHLTFSCLGDVPTWLNEGLAVYSEGPLETYSQQQLDQAIANNTLFSIRSLSGGFSEVADKADLSYSESYSIVKHLIEAHGQDQMTTLLEALRDGLTIDEALTQVYGFDVEGLEDEWRAAIGAPVRAQVPNPTPTAQPTPVPTFIPISGAPVDVTPFPTPDISALPQATTAPLDTAPALDPGTVSTAAIVVIAVLCLCLALLAIIVIIVLIARSRKNRSNQNA